MLHDITDRCLLSLASWLDYMGLQGLAYRVWFMSDDPLRIMWAEYQAEMLYESGI